MINRREGYKPAENVFFINQVFSREITNCEYTIEDILTTWSVHRHYDRVIERMTEISGVSDDRMVVVQYDTGDLDVNHNQQKLLYYVVTDNDGNFISNGGILFQHGKISFHT